MKLHSLDATDLRAALERREVCSVDLVEAFIERQKTVGPTVNAVVFPMYEEARKAAQQADQQRKAGGALPPLCGLPITIKDNFEVKGTPATLGLASRQNHVSAEDAVAVAALKSAGAIVLGKTNVPQLLLTQESDNAVYGTTRNPWNLARSPGGSSGGEAAALATGQTPLGLGSDIGGSIRIPAHFCGLVGFKPTLDRISTRGMLGGIEGQETVRAVAGPMARSVRDVELVLSALDPTFMAKHDPAVPPLRFVASGTVQTKGLRVGCFYDDGFLSPCPAIVRAEKTAKTLLEAAGATVIEFEPATPKDLIFDWLAVMSSDAATTLKEQLAGEVICKQLRASLLAAQLPATVKGPLSTLLAGLGEARLAKLLGSMGRKPVQTLWHLTARRTQLRQRELLAWQKAELSAVICPPHVLPAMPLGTSGDLALTINYMARYVWLNFPAGVVPVTRVRQDETIWSGPRPADFVSRRCAEATRGSVGLPVGVQVVAKPHCEEVALAVMAAIEAGAKNDVSFPQTPIDP